jgi:outer membrane protein, heavy metal efflux system
MRLPLAAIACALGVLAVAPAPAQVVPLTRSDAIRVALDRGVRLGGARADTSLAHAQLITATALPNPTLSATYTKDVPSYHVLADIPIDFPWLRRTRIASAQAGLVAADLRYELARVMVRLDADTTYTRTLAAREHAELSRRNAESADSLHRMAISRRDAGDASDLDVELAAVFLAQQTNLAAADSMTLAAALLDLQAVLGMATDRIAIHPTDSLTLPAATDGASIPAEPLAVAAAASSVTSADLALRAQRRSLFTTPSVTLGVEHGDDTQPGILPVFGIGIGLPLFDRNRGAVATANAERQRARAELAVARLESGSQIAHAARAQTSALARAERDRQSIAGANRVAAMSLTAYREGASALPNVLEAQRNARDVLSQYVDDAASAWVATAILRALTVAPTRSSSTP